MLRWRDEPHLPVLIRIGTAAVFVAAAVALSACGEDEKVKALQDENAELTSRIDELSGKLADAHSKAETLQSEVDEVQTAASDLGDEISRFDDDNWRDVVPQVRSEADDVATKANALDGPVSELSDATDE